MNSTIPETKAHAAKVLLLGNPALRKVCRSVDDVNNTDYRYDCARLHATLKAFRTEHGFGRAISAPQIGVALRFIAVNLGDGPFTMINPEITWSSPETFTMWDDCMSFPFLLVRVRRQRAISVRYLDDDGNIRVMDKLDQSTSELLQHEIDHLDGILAVDHALDADAIVSREVFEENPEWFTGKVDYLIVPTV
ncbi:MAG: peptide deformylase [Gammaproteobacteria bacterium]|nr:MAG: peptide deformylase [Gammaproteobacteria bacterium]